MNDQTTTTVAPQIDPSTWVDKYSDFLFRYAQSRLSDPDAAEEVVQETIVSAFKNVHQFAGRGNERAWLLGILKRKIIDIFRKHSRDPINVNEQSGDISERLFDDKGSWKKEVRSVIRKPMDSLDREEFWRVLQGCLGELPTRQADVFTRRVMDEASAQEICQEFGISANNYWVILHRARLQLSCFMKQSWFQESS